MDKRKIDEAIELIYESGNQIVCNEKEETELGWQEYQLGDTVYYGIIEDNDFYVKSGRIIGWVNKVRRSWNEPEKCKPVTFTYSNDITYTIESVDGQYEIPSKYVYGDKQKALLATIYNAVKSYKSLK